MSDMRPTIVAKSEQLNSDDLLGGPITIKITGVVVKLDEQPVALSYEGDNGKPWKPGKSMRRVLVHVWGHDSNNYIGRSLTLYRDEKVQFGGLAVGGIRISHMSDIPKEMTMALTISRANKRPFVVRPLVAVAPAAKKQTVSEWLAALEIDLTGAASENEVKEILARPDVIKIKATATGAAKDRLQGMLDAAIKRTSAPPDEIDMTEWGAEEDTGGAPVDEAAA